MDQQKVTKDNSKNKKIILMIKKRLPLYKDQLPKKYTNLALHIIKLLQNNQSKKAFDFLESDKFYSEINGLYNK